MAITDLNGMPSDPGPGGGASPERSDKFSVGFIGLGDIGAPMALRLASTRHRVVGFDVRADATERFEARGGRSAGSLVETIDDADVIHVCVTTDDELESVVVGTGGVVDIGSSGQTIVVHSTVAPRTVRDIGAHCRKHGMALLDAPVSGGGRAAALAGRMTMMVGGDASVFETMTDHLHDLADRLVHVGPHGSGQAVKLANNMMVHINRLGYLEAVSFAAGHGVSEETLNSVVNHSSGRSLAQTTFEVVDEHGVAHPRARDPDFAYRFAKDLRLALDAGEDLALALPLTASAAAVAPDAYAQRWREKAGG